MAARKRSNEQQQSSLFAPAVPVPIMCRNGCGREVEEARRSYATPTCYACLPPPAPLPINYPKSMQPASAVVVGRIAPAEPTGPEPAPYPEPQEAQRKLRVVPPPESMPEEDVIVEAVRENVFLVSTLRAHGTTVAAVYYTRKQLKMLIARGGAALEVG